MEGHALDEMPTQSHLQISLTRGGRTWSWRLAHEQLGRNLSKARTGISKQKSPLIDDNVKGVSSDSLERYVDSFPESDWSASDFNVDKYVVTSCLDHDMKIGNPANMVEVREFPLRIRGRLQVFCQVRSPAGSLSSRDHQSERWEESGCRRNPDRNGIGG